MGTDQSLRAVAGRFGGARDDYDDYDDYDQIYGDEPLRRSPPAQERAVRPLAVVRPPRVEVSLVTPRDFDAAQRIADLLRAGGPVIVDLLGCEPDLTIRLTDFCSGLAYALDGRLHFIGEKVVLLAPHNVELSGAGPGALQERRFFNQV